MTKLISNFFKITLLILLTIPLLALAKEVQSEREVISEVKKIEDIAKSTGEVDPVNCINAEVPKKEVNNTEEELKDFKGNPLNLTSMSYSKAKKIFNKMKNQKHIPFHYPEDGCFARAHEMSMLMEKEKIITGKVFIEGSLRVETKSAENGFVEWWYHVAPILLVNKKGKKEVYVIDPSIFNKPVPVQEWYDIQIKHKDGKMDKNYYTPRFYYTPSTTDLELTDYRSEDIQDTKEVMEKYIEIQKEREDKNQGDKK